MTEGKLLMVTPSNVQRSGGRVEVDRHFSNNLRAYLENFERVTVVCADGRPPQQQNMVPWDGIPGRDRAELVLLPLSYREDRYLRHRSAVARRLKKEIAAADYLLLAPHSAFDWPTLAAKLALQMGRSYAIDADWALDHVAWSQWADMPWSLNKLRKYLWIKSHGRRYRDILKRSDVALLQGATVFDACKVIAPNPHQVLNVQITDEDRITLAELAAKLDRAAGGGPLRIMYAGRAIGMKGPFDWLKALAAARETGVPFEATWYGDGDLLPEMRQFASAQGLDDAVRFAGEVDRREITRALRESDLFLFCHKTQESPRCLVEALAAGTPILGYHSLYAADLVEPDGGGQFVEIDDIAGLTGMLGALARDRRTLVDLIRKAYQSGRKFDREAAIKERIDLIKKFVRPAPNRRGTVPEPVGEVRTITAA